MFINPANMPLLGIRYLKESISQQENSRNQSMRDVSSEWRSDKGKMKFWAEPDPNYIPLDVVRAAHELAHEGKSICDPHDLVKKNIEELGIPFDIRDQKNWDSISKSCDSYHAQRDKLMGDIEPFLEGLNTYLKGIF